MNNDTNEKTEPQYPQHAEAAKAAETAETAETAKKDNTSRMATLLGAMRRERNGAVADAMRLYGRPYGLNYGVSLPTLRTLARAEGCDHDFARYLYLQQVRELQLAAFHIADPSRVTDAELPFWAAGMLNSEMAEEGAFALFRRVESLGKLFDAWTHPGSDPLLTYAALMAGARAASPRTAWAATAAACVTRAAESGVAESHLLAQGATALLAALAARDEAAREATREALATLGAHPDEAYVRDELAWRLEA